jgi:nicotinamide-nucleotide amidase
MREDMLILAEKIIKSHADKDQMIAIAESCTGGMVSAALTEIAGSSAVIDRGFVTYSNAAKSELLGVDLKIIEKHGAVSEIVARAMAQGALARSNADITVSITGIAGPGGGCAEKPVGTVMFGRAINGQSVESWHKAFGTDKNRAEIRHQAALFALELLLP